MLPPESTATAGVGNRSGWSRTAATATAPAGSTTILARSSSSTSACEIDSSETVTMSSTWAMISANGTVPGQATAIPSAIAAKLPSGVKSGCSSTSCAPMPALCRTSR